MELFNRACSLAGVAVVAVMGWMIVVWAFSPIVAEAVNAFHQAFGY